VSDVAVNLTGIDLSSSTAAGTARKATPAQNGMGHAHDAPSHGPTEVTITSTASLLAHLQQSLAGMPAVDQQRVDSIRKALAQGKYHMNPDSIATGLIQSERALAALPLPEA
jgi:negative regulator of flagellin synthesis FlgM